MCNSIITIENPQPNAETIAAIEEVQKMKDSPSIGQAYENIDDMMEELL